MPRILIAALVVATLTPAPAKAEKIELTDRMVTLYGAINSGSIGKAVKKILAFDAVSNDTIWLMIDSYGGSVDAGFILIDLMRSIKSPVNAVVVSKAYSMGAIITVFCKKRYIYEHATMMFHEASYGALGEDPSIRSRIDFNTKYLDRIHREIAKLIKMPHKEYRAKIRDAWWVLGPEAVKARFVDAMVTGVTYRTLPTETTEVKRTRIIKKRVMTRPKTKGPRALDIPR